MNKFKVGDTVKVVNCGCGFNFNDLGGEYTIKDVKERGYGHRVGILLNEYLNGCYDGYCGEASFELVWQPVAGEMIEVDDCNDFSDSSEEKFWGMFEGHFMCYGGGYYRYPVPYIYARQIKKHVITIDGKDIELSEESYRALKKQFEE